MRNIPARDRRALALGGGAIALAILVFRGFPLAVHAVVALRDRATEQAATLARVEEVVVRGPAVRDSLAVALRAIVGLAPALVEGTTSADAQASLSGLLSVLADRHAMKILRVDPLPDSSLGVFHRVSLHAEVEGDMVGVTGLLRSVETGEPLLSVTNLALETLDPIPHPRAPEVLHLRIDVSGYYLPRDK